MMSKESVNLAQLVADIKLTLQSRYELPVWVVAEISEMNLNRSGHCYLELIEKDPVSDKIIAKCRATIWSFAFRTIKAYFETTTGESFRAGLKVLLCASVEFHEVYGLSLNIQDVDPRFTLGDMARKRAMIVEQLTDEGVIEMNKNLVLHLVPQHVAVISSETAAGYGDFCDQLNNNGFGFRFYTQIFPAVMQGEKASESIINALENVYNRIDDFDLVAIIRGGGSKADLSCFDDYNLAYFITQFPMPVFTGIGHERDDTVTDIVAHTRLKTPTAVAEHLISLVSAFDDRLNEYTGLLDDLTLDIFDKNEYLLEKLTQRLQTTSVEMLQTNQEYLIWSKSRLINGVRLLQYNQMQNLESFKQEISVLAKGMINQETGNLEFRGKRLNKWLNNYFIRKERYLQHMNEKAEWVNPETILNKGYALVTHNGNKVTNSNSLRKGDIIDVKLAKGELTSEVLKVNKSGSKEN